MKNVLKLFALCSLSLSIITALPVKNEHRDQLLKGVSEVGSTWYNLGNIVVFGPNAFGVVGGVSRPGGGFQAGVAAAVNGTTGARLLCYGNHMYTGGIFEEEGFEETGVFLINAMDWACRDNSREKCRIVLGTRETSRTSDFLKKHGFMNITQIGGGGLRAVINEMDVVLEKYVTRMTDDDFAVIPDYLAKGKSLMVFDGNDGITMREIRATNEIIKDFGLAFALEPLTHPADTTRVTSKFNTSSLFLEKTYFPEAIKLLREFAFQGAVLTPQEIATVTGIVATMVEYGPSNDTLMAEFSQIYRAWGRPSEAQYFADPLNRTFIGIESQLSTVFNTIGKEEIVLEHPAHKIFPGSVTENGTETGTNVTVYYYRAWQSTGLYARPGQVVTLRVIEAFKDQSPTCRVRIGANTDNVASHSTWRRLPLLSISKDFQFAQDAVLKLNSPYGGNVYVDCQNMPNADPEAAQATVRIEGCVKSATFIIGKSDLAEWRNVDRFSPAPWGELVDPMRIIFTHPRDVLAKLENPDEVIKVWGEVIDKFLELTGGSLNNAERLVQDIQISAGYAHSGYPIMFTWDSDLQDFVNITHFREVGNWAALHELGHNFQRFVYNPPGFGEVSNNLMALYVCSTYLNVPRAEWGRMHPNLRNEKLVEMMQNYISEGKDWSKHGNWVALGMLIQIQEKYGWDVYRNSFVKWQSLSNPPGSSDAERQKLWIVSLSQEAGINLIRLFDSWGFPVPADAAEEISHLPVTPHTIESYLEELQSRPIIHFEENKIAEKFQCGHSDF